MEHHCKIICVWYIYVQIIYLAISFAAFLELLSDPKSTFGTMTSNDPCETRIESPGWGFILPEIWLSSPNFFFLNGTNISFIYVKNHLYLCFCFFSGGRTSWPSIWSVSKTFVLGVRQKMAEFGPRFLVKQSRQFFFANVGTCFYFIHFFFQDLFLENCSTNISPFYPLKFLNKSLYSSPPPMVRTTHLTLTDIPPTNQPSIQDGPLPSL